MSDYDRICLRRFAYTPFGTFGEINAHGWRCFTVERPWYDNKPYMSCIPSGLYRMKLSTYHHRTTDPADDYVTYEVVGVPGRSLIKIHRGNTMDDVQGCIAVGSWLGYLGHKWAVIESRLAHERLMHVLGGVPELELEIYNTPELSEA